MTTRLVLHPRHLTHLRHHAEGSYPMECCGILIGRQNGHTVEVDILVVAPNAAHQNATRRFVIPPELLLATHRQARDESREVVGYYHSHPDHPALPSRTDRQHAWPGVSYLIVSVEGGQAGDIRSWRLEDEAADFHQEPWTLADPSSP